MKNSSSRMASFGGGLITLRREHLPRIGEANLVLGVVGAARHREERQKLAELVNRQDVRFDRVSRRCRCHRFRAWRLRGAGFAGNPSTSRRKYSRAANHFRSASASVPRSKSHWSASINPAGGNFAAVPQAPDARNDASATTKRRAPVGDRRRARTDRINMQRINLT